MLRNAAERNQPEEKRKRLLQQFQQHNGQSADGIDTVQERLSKSEDQQLLDVLLECIPAGITVAAAGEDKICMVSKYSRQFIGCPREALEGLPLQEYVQKWDVLRLDGTTAPPAEELPLVRATRQGQVVADEEWLLRSRDGRTIRVLCNASPIRNGGGDIIGGVVAWLDITGRQQAEEALAQLAAIVESSEDAIFSHSLEGVILTWNHAAERLYGYSAEEIKGHSMFLLAPADRSDELRDILKKIQRGERLVSFETVRVRKDGSRVEVSVSVAPIRDRAGRIIAAAKIDRDISERKQTERSLRQSEERYRLIVETAAEGIKTLDRDSRITFINSRGASLLGFSVEEMLHRSMFDFVFLEDLAEVRRELTLLFRGTREEADVRLRHKDGSPLWVHYVASPIPDDRGGYNGALFMASNITLRKEAERRALQAERLAAIGQVVAGLAHESGNALQRSQACLRMLVLQVEGQPEALDLVDRMQKAQDHLQHLFEDVRNYAAPVHLELLTCDLSDVWREAWSQLDNSREGRDVAFREETSELDLHCYADHLRLVQVFRNLFENTLAACRDPVVLSVRCSVAVIAGKPAIQVAVRDNGPGIAAEARPKLFEPFYTTKTKGTGLGLSIVRRIIEAHGGEIAVGDSAGSGAEILITLPRGNHEPFAAHHCSG